MTDSSAAGRPRYCRSTFWERHLCPALREEQRGNVVATPFTTPAVGNIHFQLMPPVSTSAVRDNPDGCVSRLISADAVVAIYSITSNDDEPFLGERVAAASACVSDASAVFASRS